MGFVLFLFFFLLLLPHSGNSNTIFVKYVRFTFVNDFASRALLRTVTNRDCRRVRMYTYSFHFARPIHRLTNATPSPARIQPYPSHDACFTSQWSWYGRVTPLGSDRSPIPSNSDRYTACWCDVVTVCAMYSACACSPLFPRVSVLTRSVCRRKGKGLRCQPLWSMQKKQ